MQDHASSSTVLVIGANRGIGLNLLKWFASHGWNAIGSIRPQTIAAKDASLADLEATGARVIEVDFCDESTVAAAAATLKDVTIDVLINAGGIPPRPEDHREWDQAMLRNQFDVMSIGPFLCSKHFTPNLAKSPNARIINITSEWGSAQNCRSDADGTSGAFLGYRMAKAALNMQTACLSHQLRDKNIIVICINPGWLLTRMTKVWQEGMDNMTTCINSMCALIENVKSEQSGDYYNWDGKPINW